MPFCGLQHIYTYPDVIVVCGKPRLLEDAYLGTLLNPFLIVELLFATNRRLPQRREVRPLPHNRIAEEYVLVWQDKKRVARYTKQDDESWVLRDFIGEEAEIVLSSIECQLPMEDVYDKVGF